ncbi:MAG: helix-turn-helix domain-containing protein, partial [Pseudonocardiaceae bacterium]
MSNPDARTARLRRELDEVRVILHGHIDRTVNDLQHALTHVSESRVPLGSRLAEVALAELTATDPGVRVQPDTVMAVTAEYYGFTVDQLRGPRKTADLTKARQVGMYLCRELTGLSLPRIGGEFVRDHTTVMHADRKIRAEVQSVPRTRERVTELSGLIKRQAAMDAVGGLRGRPAAAE